MKRNAGVCVLALVAALASLTSCDDMNDEGANRPVIAGEALADPAVIQHESLYYLYGTAANANHYDVFVSQDGQSWEKHGTVFARDSNLLWAPDVFPDPPSGRFYLYYSLEFSAGVAVADSPLGPFVDTGILIEDAIDAHMYFEDGHYFLYYATTGEKIRTLEQMGKRIFGGMLESLFGDEESMLSSNIYVQRMRSPTETSGEAALLLQPSEPWEKGYSMWVVEAPWLLKEKNRYYLMYSGGPTHESSYAIGIATADSPLGPFHKSAQNPLLYSTSDAAVFGRKVDGPGHHSVVRENDGRYRIYFHQNASRLNLGMGRRYTARGELLIDDAGTLEVRLGDDSQLPRNHAGTRGSRHGARP
ncbi:MAG: family 43 glycosylhydrolase [Gammaproteobacteria bacterium]|nr:family 43 glycosylhydrolase [Gammaproteobacteria bacterium]MBP6229826.1 family 43 glycosylhydrolase [Pseudomonadales bacterium]MBK7520659.1 family 43 glycosylhydrolase [Gammaproteobacteria bacterium]MBK7728428.1 family 43 glycosylhydrolase [Gammaproteobacteria bacterium]MBK8308355.1 family 43 glycosylhydrolase [Gammaproteobacteria bacterium]